MRRLVTLLLVIPLLGALAAPVAAQSPATTEELLAGMVTVQVEPGVFRVDDDGVRDLAKNSNLDIVAGHDGGIWLLRNRRFFRLGSSEWLAWPTETPRLAEFPRLAAEFEVAPGGTIWAAGQSFDGQSWTNHFEEDDRAPFEVTPDGTLWAAWRDPEQADLLVFGYLDEEGWKALGHIHVMPENILVVGPDDIWGRTWAWIGPGPLVRFADGAWQEQRDVAGAPQLVALGPDGTLWGVFSDWDAESVDLARFDGDEWSRWSLLDTGFGPGAEAHQFEVAPDGSVWFGVRAGPLGGSFRGCDGVSRFDGETWQRYLSGLCVRAIDVTADGAVWLLAKEPDAGLRRVYVITPEAVAAAE